VSFVDLFLQFFDLSVYDGNNLRAKNNHNYTCSILQDGASYTLVEDVVVDDEEAAQILAAVEANGDSEVHEYWRCGCKQLFLSESALRKHEYEQHGAPIQSNKVRISYLTLTVQSKHLFNNFS
jgi:hypothetical protein